MFEILFIYLNGVVFKEKVHTLSGVNALIDSCQNDENSTWLNEILVLYSKSSDGTFFKIKQIKLSDQESEERFDTIENKNENINESNPIK